MYNHNQYCVLEENRGQGFLEMMKDVNIQMERNIAHTEQDIYK